MFNVQVTEFMLPNGQTRLIDDCSIPDRYMGAYSSMVEAGYRLECETLRTGQVSVTVCHSAHGDCALKLINTMDELESTIINLLEEEAWLCPISK